MAPSNVVPERYMTWCNGNKEEAARRWNETLQWRKDNKINDIIDTPQPHFHHCREILPVYLHERSRKNMPVLWEHLGKLNLARADELQLDSDVLIRSYYFLVECIWKVALDKGENDDDLAQFITVEDASGVRLRSLTARVLKLLGVLAGVMKKHHPERCYKTYIINASPWFKIPWAIVSPLFGARTRSKIVILGTNFFKTMQEEIDVSHIPRKYGGTSDRELGDADDDRKIQALVEKLTKPGAHSIGKKNGIAEKGVEDTTPSVGGDAFATNNLDDEGS